MAETPQRFEEFARLSLSSAGLSPEEEALAQAEMLQQMKDVLLRAEADGVPLQEAEVEILFAWNPLLLARHPLRFRMVSPIVLLASRVFLRWFLFFLPLCVPFDLPAAALFAALLALITLGHRFLQRPVIREREVRRGRDRMNLQSIEFIAVKRGGKLELAGGGRQMGLSLREPGSRAVLAIAMALHPDAADLSVHDFLKREEIKPPRGFFFILFLTQPWLLLMAFMVIATIAIWPMVEVPRWLMFLWVACCLLGFAHAYMQRMVAARAAAWLMAVILLSTLYGALSLYRGDPLTAPGAMVLAITAMAAAVLLSMSRKRLVLAVAMAMMIPGIIAAPFMKPVRNAPALSVQLGGESRHLQWIDDDFAAAIVWAPPKSKLVVSDGAEWNAVDLDSGDWLFLGKHQGDLLLHHREPAPTEGFLTGSLGKAQVYKVHRDGALTEVMKLTAHYGPPAIPGASRSVSPGRRYFATTRAVPLYDGQLKVHQIHLINSENGRVFEHESFRSDFILDWDSESTVLVPRFTELTKDEKMTSDWSARYYQGVRDPMTPFDPSLLGSSLQIYRLNADTGAKDLVTSITLQKAAEIVAAPTSGTLLLKNWPNYDGLIILDLATRKETPVHSGLQTSDIGPVLGWEDGRFLALIQPRSGDLTLLNETGTMTALPSIAGSVHAAEFSPDGRFLAIVARQRYGNWESDLVLPRLLVIRLSDSEVFRLATWNLEPGDVIAQGIWQRPQLRFSPNGGELAVTYCRQHDWWSRERNREWEWELFLFDSAAWGE